jgi:signal transduction histidine kinase
MISIRDNGPGMSEETLKRASEAFYSTRENGTGLGLAVVNEVLKAHKGKMLINSIEGKGTEVICILPLHEMTIKNSESKCLEL